MKVLIASENKTKIEGTYNCLKHYYDDVIVEGISVDSKVKDQPLNDETFDGAKNRIEALIEYAKNNNKFYDLYISLESGMIQQYNKHFISTVACISDNDNNISFGISPTYPIPEKYVEQVLKENLNCIARKLFSEPNAGKTTGTIHFLTKGIYTRTILNESAVNMALTSHLNKDIWM